MTIALCAAAALALVVALWRVQLRTADASTVDVAWTALVGGGAIVAALTVDGDPVRRTVVACLVVAWAARLGGHLVIDRVRAPGEDGRYRALRERWGASAARNFLVLYLAQGVIAALFIVPIMAAMRGGGMDAWAFAGIAVWVVALAGEWIADRQLARFRADPHHRGAVCRSGLWRYSRHPNYFFEWLHWWSYVLMAQGAPASFIGPVAMLVFLFRVTGIPHTERQALRSRGQAYREYQRATSIFIPWPTRRVGA